MSQSPSLFGGLGGTFSKPEWPKPNPVIFTNVGLAPDMSIEVLKQIFHVNSLVLKIHSEYFRACLDSPEKASASGTFKCNWVTHMDGSEYSLMPKEQSTDEGKVFAGNHGQEIDGWNLLLRAIHDWPFRIADAKQLCHLTELASLYQMLPAISNALNGVLLNDSGLVASIPENCVMLLEAAFKLRNEALFRECFVHVMGSWTTPRYHQLKTAKLKELAADTNICFL